MPWRGTIKETVGLERLKGMHLNDCLRDFNSRVDRHWHIGEGKIGLDGFQAAAEPPCFQGRSEDHGNAEEYRRGRPEEHEGRPIIVKVKTTMRRQPMKKIVNIAILLLFMTADSCFTRQTLRISWAYGTPRIRMRKWRFSNAERSTAARLSG